MRAFLFRGLAGTVFSTGIDRLAKKLNAAGISASVHSWADRREVEAEAVSRYRTGEFTGPVFLIGHSLGGNSANAMAVHLSENHVPVGYVATIDPTVATPGPAGVPADNFRSWDIRARKIRGATDFKRKDLNHIQIDKDRKVHERIIAMCLYLGIDPVEEQQTTASDESDRANDDLPVNNALGRTIGNLLNGRKTGAGLLGILVALIVPLFQPHAADISSVLDMPLSASGTALPIFLALFVWGVLGKAEKWVKGLIRN
jgi:hypothetical protein